MNEEIYTESSNQKIRKATSLVNELNQLMKEMALDDSILTLVLTKHEHDDEIPTTIVGLDFYSRRWSTRNAQSR